MSLNIKNEEADQLARALAELTGETVTAAVTEALRERLERVRRRLRKENRVQDLLAIGGDCAARLKEPYRRSTSPTALRRDGVAEMIVDSSALVAILRGEPETQRFSEAPLPRRMFMPRLGGDVSRSGDRHRCVARSHREPYALDQFFERGRHSESSP